MADSIQIMEERLKAVVKALQGLLHFVYVHIEAPDEMGHQGSTDDKIKAIELIETSRSASGRRTCRAGGQDADSSGSSDACARAYSYR